MSTPTIKIYNQQSQIDVLIESFQGPIGPQGNGLTDEQIQSAVDATAAATTAAANADAAREAIQGDLSSLKDTKADAITDTSARAASHDLYAQRGRLGVTLYGATTETGTGDKSPDNPYEISGVDVARVHVGGENLFRIDAISSTVAGVTTTTDGNGRFTMSGTMGYSGYPITAKTLLAPIRILPGLKICGKNTSDAQITLCFTLDSGAEMVANIPAGNEKYIDISSSRVGRTIVSFRMYAPSETTFSGNVDVMLAYSDDTTFEPYTANVITPPLLPNGAPLMGNGTVDDTVENDVASGCDCCETFSGTEGWKKTGAPAIGTTGGVYQIALSNLCENDTTKFSNSYVGKSNQAVWNEESSPCAAITTIDGVSYLRVRDTAQTLEEFTAKLSANPLTVYYRSTDYTPEKDLRVARVVRRWNTYVLTGDEKYQATATIGEYGYYFYCYSNPVSVTSADAVVCNMLTPNMELKESNSNSASYINTVSAGASSANPRFIVSHELLGTTAGSTTSECLAAAKAWVKALYDAGTPLTVSVQLATPEIYMTDPLTLRKPDTLTTDTVTVTGSGETAVEYPHDTKHYIDSQIAAAVALALNR